VPAGPKPRYIFYFCFSLLSLFFIKKTFNITKFKIKKHDFSLNIKIKLFYTIFTGWAMLCWVGLTGPFSGSCRR
jgi:hypothetical protein